MQRKGSAPPKERINITYRPATRANERVELPLKILVMADLTGQPDEVPFEEKEPIMIDKDNFKSVMKAQNLKVLTRVKNRLTDDADRDLPVTLSVGSLADLTPGGIAKQVPELARLLQLRDALSSLKSPLGNRKSFRQKIEQIISNPGARARIMAELGVDESAHTSVAKSDPATDE